MLRSIHIGENEKDLRKEILKETERFEDIIRNIALKYYRNKSKVEKHHKDSESKRLQLQRDISTILNGVFQPAFTYSVLMNLDVVPKKILKVDELVPYRCNFPPELTIKSVNSPRKDPHHPCNRRIGKNVYFCSYPRHLAYAKKLNLPINEDEVKARGITLPERPPKVKKPKDKKTNSKGKTKGKKPREKVAKSSSDMDIDAVKSEDALKSEEHAANNQDVDVDDDDWNMDEMDIDTLEELIELDEDHEKDHEKDEKVDDKVIDRLRCFHVNVSDGKRCESSGSHNDPFDPEVTYCEEHIHVSDSLLDKLEESEEVEMLKEYLRVHRLDEEITEARMNNDTETLMKLCRQRYTYGVNCYIGLDKELHKYIMM